MNRPLFLFVISCLFSFLTFSQEERYEDLSNANVDEYEILAPINDPSSQGQRLFVEELLDVAGYAPEKITVYQTLPNAARVYRVQLDSINSGLIFIRWNSTKKENFIANKLIEPEWYYNLNVAREVLRKQTEKTTFSVNDVALQAPDQTKITPEELKAFRKKQSEVDAFIMTKNQEKKRKKSKD